MLLLFYSDFYMPLLTLVIYLFHWKKMPKRDVFIFYYLIANIVLYGISDIMSYHSVNNLFLYHFFTWGELVSISYYILRLMLNKPYFVFFTLSGVYTIFEILNVVYWEPLHIFNSNGGAVSNLLILILSMYYMLQLSKSDDILHFQTLPAFWYISGFLVNAAISAIVFIVYKLYALFNVNNEGKTAWVIMIFAIMLKFILIIVGLLCYKRQQLRPLRQYPS